jgi:Domain of unknown function (DUF4337)
LEREQSQAGTIMETSEITETLHEAAEHDEKHGPGHAPVPGHKVGDETFRKRVGILIGVFAVMLAIIETAGNAAMKETINSNIKSSDAYSFYQARNIRQTATRLAADQLDMLILTRPDLPESAVGAIKEKALAYRKQADKWEDDPEGKEGKKQLDEKGKEAAAERDIAQGRDENFEFAAAMLQISVVLASSSILHASRPLVWISALFALCGSIIALNGFLGLVTLPFGH